MKNLQIKMIRPDTKGRIALGKLAEGVSRFRVIVDDERRIILEPMVEIPASEQWTFKNTTALKKLKKGLLDAAKGRVSSLGSFAEYIDDDE